MAKKSQRRPPRNEKEQAGCISGLISIFDFRHGRSTRKLLADRRRGNRQAIGTEFARARLKLPDSNVKNQDSEDGRGSKILLPDTARTSVKKLMEEEMFNDQGQKKQINDSDVGPKISDAEFGSHTRKYHKRRNKTSKKLADFHIFDSDTEEPEKSCDQVQAEKTLDNSDLEIIIQELCQLHQKNSSYVGHLQSDHSSRMQLDQAGVVDEEKLTAAIKVFVDRSLCKSHHAREDGQLQHSTEIVDALHRLSSNKDLLFNFLQDPNSLLVKQNKGLEETEIEKDTETNPLPRSDFLKEKATQSKTDDLINQKPRKFFRRRSKSQEHFPLTEREKCQSSNKIVILKPGPATLQQTDNEISTRSSMSSHNPTGNKIHGEKSQFSFTEIKRKLKQAIRKEKQDIFSDGTIHKSRPDNQKRHDFDKGVAGENIGWWSPNRNHFYIERFAKPSVSSKRGETIGRPNPTEATSADDYLKPKVSNIYLEAKKHLLEMLSSGNDDAELSSQKLPKSLGRILSFSDYSYSPSCSPRGSKEESAVSTPMKLSPRVTAQSVNGNTKLVEENVNNHLSSSGQSSENLSCLPCENSEEKIESPNESASVAYDHSLSSLVEENPPSTSNITTSEDHVEIIETTDALIQEANEIPLASFESSTSVDIEDVIIGDAAEECDEDMLTQTVKMESVGESQIVSSLEASPSHSVTEKVEDSVDSIDRTGRPSPVSVLDPLFAEDDISPARIISRPVSFVLKHGYLNFLAELEIEPRHIDFEEQRCSVDQGISMQTSLQDEESAFEYVEAVLLGSGLNWDEYLLSWLSSRPILDSVLFDEVELFSSRSRAEQKLLFDCTNEVLEELIQAKLEVSSIDLFLHFFVSFDTANSLVLSMCGSFSTKACN
ncbi:hypothetical protein M9H77_33258 [Catharanthus roseus]|uniref:Uncharacterized protein n=1 Tax=Catharanthus roseus TaxID=4058 RepID=A0ACB9ZID6_CATRO|nr:hypothetical protein M9H77_33258 [Catharanthus roseus]